MTREVRSFWSLERGDPHSQRAISPGSRSSPSRADSGARRAGHLGKSASQPASAKRDSAVPVQGAQYRNPVVEDRRR